MSGSKVKPVMKQATVIILLAMFSIIILGCEMQKGSNDVNDGIPNQSITPDGLPSPTNPSFLVFTQTNLLTLTPVLQKETSPVQSATPLPLQEEKEIPVCNLNGIPKIPERNFGLYGKIIYQNEDRKGLYTIGGEPLERSKLPVSENVDYQLVGLSPDGKWFAFTALLSEDQIIQSNVLPLKLLSSSGDLVEKTIDFQPLMAQFDEPMQVIGWGGADGDWINNDLLVLQIYYKSIYSDVGPRIPALLGPFSGEWHQEKIEMLQNAYFQHMVGFSGDLSRAVFTGDQGIEMVDLNNQTIRTVDTNQYLIQTGVFSGPFYSWAPDSSMVIYGRVIPSKDYHGISLVTRDGEKLKGITFPRYSDGSSSFWVQNLKWSPDSRLVAITGEIKNANGSENRKIVYVYDVSQNSFIYQCSLTTTDPVSTILWSPDVRSFLLDTDTPGSPVILYDIYSKQVVTLPIIGSVGGWSDKFP